MNLKQPSPEKLEWLQTYWLLIWMHAYRPEGQIESVS